MIDVVVKVGGSLIGHPKDLDAVLHAIDASARAGRHLLIVPGGGPFADAVRDVDARLRLDGSAAHWMAVLAMDQCAYFLASRLAGSRIVRGPADIEAAMAECRPAVLAPFDWLHAVDPLRHSWDITSDSIAAWVASMVGAARLVVVKAPHAQGSDLVDPGFDRTLSPRIHVAIVPANEITAFRAALNDTTAAR